MHESRVEYLFNFIAHANRLPNGNYRYDVSFASGPEEGFGQEYGPFLGKYALTGGLRPLLSLFDALGNWVPGFAISGYGTQDIKGETFEETLKLKRAAYSLDPQLASTFSQLGYEQSRWGGNLSPEQFRTFLDTAASRFNWFERTYGSPAHILEMTNSRASGY